MISRYTMIKGLTHHLFFILCLLCFNVNAQQLSCEACDEKFEVDIENIAQAEFCAECYFSNADSLSGAKLIQQIGDLLFKYGSLDSSLSYVQYSARIFHKLGEGWLEADALAGAGQIYSTNGEYELGIEKFEDAIAIVELPQYNDSIHPYYSHIAEVMYVLDEYEQAVVYARRGMNLYERFEQSFYYRATAYSLASYYMSLSEFEKADSVITIANSIEVPEAYQQYCYLQQKRTEARYYYNIDEDGKAAEAYRSLLDFADPDSDFGLYVEVYIGLANAYFALDENAKAKELFEEVIQNSRTEDNVYFLEDVLKSYANFLAETGGNEEANAVYNQLVILMDSLASVERLHDIRELHVVDIEQDNFDLKDENEAKALLIQSYEEYDILQKWLIAISFIFIVVLTLFALRIWRTSKQLMQSRRLLKSQNDQLEEIDRQRIELVKIVGHDLRGPMWALRNFLELSSSGRIPENDLASMQSNAIKGLSQTQELLENLTDWAQASAGMIVGQRTTFALKEMIEGLVDTYRLHAQTKRITIHLDVSGDILVHIDERALSFILRNLIENSIKYTEGTDLKVLSFQRGQLVDIHVSDNGEGMDPEMLEAINTQGQIVSKGGSLGEGGKGLGLRAVQMICEEIDVKLEVNSEKGKGTTMKIIGVPIVS